MAFAHTSSSKACTEAAAERTTCSRSEFRHALIEALPELGRPTHPDQVDRPDAAA